MIGSLKRAVDRAQFFPGALGLFVNPFYFARSGLLEHIRALAPRISGELLDVGCGSKPYAELFAVTRYVGLEIDTPAAREKKQADAFYDGERFPFEAETFDAVFTSQVLEHVFNPDVFLGELQRVLRPDGQLLLTVPFVWDEHEQPFDFARYSSFGLAHLLKAHGFEIVEHRRSLADMRTPLQVLNAYLYKTVTVRQPYLRLLALSALTTPLNILGRLTYRLFPRNPDLYLDHIVLARKLANEPRRLP